MCGINGLFSFNNSKEATCNLIQKMNKIIRHRGPDDNGLCLFNEDEKLELYSLNSEHVSKYSDKKFSVGLGHQRLSILDLTVAGRQPLCDDSKRYWITFNGEIYNYIDLANELKSFGFIFKTKTDTEVVLYAFIKWGKDCFKKLNGMWALAIYDRKNKEIILSRDRFGKKPLYYHLNKNFLIFSSEPKGIFQNNKILKRPNIKKCSRYAGGHYRHIDNDHTTFYDEVFQVPNSTTLTFKESGKVIKEKYWELKNFEKPEKKFNFEDLKTQFIDILRDSVKIRLQSDVPVGTMLSGGMDSTSMTALAFEQNKNILAFSSVSEGESFDESDYINSFLEKVPIKHSYITPSEQELLATLNEMLFYHDEPICTVTWFSLYSIATQISNTDIKVVLTGHGGDELLAGYWDHFHYHWYDMHSNNMDTKYEIDSWINNHNRSKGEIIENKNLIENSINNREIEYQKFGSYFSYLNFNRKKDFFIPYISVPFNGELNRRLYLELLYETVPATLRAEDRNLMAHSIENRCPFLDYRLSEFCFNIDNSYKIQNGLGKYILRQAVKDLIPKKIWNRKDKMGHNVPADQWWRDKIKDRFLYLFDKKSVLNDQIYNIPKVRDLFKKHIDGENHYMFFWQFLNLHHWYKIHFEDNN